MKGFMENWPEYVQKHYMRHYQAGFQAIVNLPTDTGEERAKRMFSMAVLHRRILRHVEKMHPVYFL